MGTKQIVVLFAFQVFSLLQCFSSGKYFDISFKISGEYIRTSYFHSAARLLHGGVPAMFFLSVYLFSLKTQCE